MEPQRIDRPRIAAAVREILAAIGEDLDRPGLERTPERVADAYADFFAGVGADADDALTETVPVGPDSGELVLLRDLSFRSVCEHHLLPFHGTAHLAYTPSERVVGFGSLSRLLNTLAARPQVQERLCEEIATAIVRCLAPHGVLVVLEASHGCLTDRGPKERASSVVTIASRGALAERSARQELMRLIGVGS